MGVWGVFAGSGLSFLRETVGFFGEEGILFPKLQCHVRVRPRLRGHGSELLLPPPFQAAAVMGLNAEFGRVVGTDSSPRGALICVIGSSRGSSIAPLNWPRIETPRRRGARPS